MNFNILALSCLLTLGSAWNQPVINSGSCSAHQSSCCGIAGKLDKLISTLQVIAERMPGTTPATSVPVTSTDTETQTCPHGSFENPASSCSNISIDCPSGEYWIQTDSSTLPVQVYCDTNQRNCSCNTTGGWARVANLDMTDPTQQCPEGFGQITRTEPPLRTCGQPGRTCMSTTFAVHGIQYSYVCGRIVAYQVGSPNAFYFSQAGFNSYYVTGISLTHGTPRQHIWTFAGAVSEMWRDDASVCPCHRSSTGSYGWSVPPYVGEDYFCDTALRGSTFSDGTFYPDDPLWDGQGCGSASTCCGLNNPPWFCRQLPQPTTDDIELRICNAEGSPSTGSTPFEVVEIFVH